MTVTKTSAVDEIFTYVITYQVDADFIVYPNGQTSQVCNDVTFVENGITISDDDVCSCPENNVICPIDNSCVPE